MLYDGLDCVADYDEYETLLRYYITPFMDENMLMNVASGGAPATDYFYAQDGLGTIRQIFDTSHSLVNNYDYEGFGTNSGKSEIIYNRFRYTGREFDEETESTFTLSTSTLKNDGLYYYRARTYDTSVGSFTSRAPIPYANLYPYCAANPINFTDPSGQKYIKIGFDGCIPCVRKQIRCLVSKIYDALSKASRMIHNYLILAREERAGGEGFSGCTTSALADYQELEDNLNSGYSIFDTSSTSGYSSVGFDRSNSYHIRALENVLRFIDNILDNITDSNGIWDFTCRSSYAMDNLGSWGTYSHWLKFNEDYLCKNSVLSNSDQGAHYTQMGLGLEGFNAHTIVHELSHGAGTVDSICVSVRNRYNRTVYHSMESIYIGNWRYSELSYWNRMNHADSIAAFIMTYYNPSPPCKMDPECCSEMKSSPRYIAEWLSN